MLDAGISLMQYLVAINQVKAVEWGLNAQQAMLFAFLHQVPTWANARQIDGHTYFNIGVPMILTPLSLARASRASSNERPSRQTTASRK
jgi:hypothetical protein